MEFVKKMKKREFIEMGLKAGAAILAAFIAIILMEGMIYSIQLNALKTKATQTLAVSGSTVAYCIKESDDKYFVLYYNEGAKDADGNLAEWSASKDKNKYLTREQCEKLVTDKIVNKVEFNAPNAFIFSITPVHYVVMSLFVAAVAGFFVYKFIALNKQYVKIEEEFIKTGTIQLG